MQNQRNEDRESQFPALFLVLAHLGAARAAAFTFRKSYRTSPSLTTSPLTRAHPGVVKQILLRVAAVLSEIAVAKFPELLRRQLSFPRKILLAQDALDPDIDRKRPQALISEEHYAIRHLRAHAR